MKFLIPCVVVVTVLGSPARVDAQTPPPRPERPYRGLFGGGVGNSQQLLTLRLSLGGGYDDNIFADNGSGTDLSTSVSHPQLAKSGSYGQLTGSLSYSLDRRRISFGASAGASTRYYSRGLDGLLGAYHGGVGATYRLGSRQTIVANQSAAYQPYVQLYMFPRLFELPLGEGMVPSLDLVTARESLASYGSDVTYTLTVGRQSSIGADYHRLFSDFESGQFDFVSQSGHVRYSHGLAKGLAVRVGYGYTDARYTQLDEYPRTSWQSWDVGLDFSRALSFSRKTTFSFSTGSTALGDKEQTYYRFIGDARLNHELGRTWNASLAYSRGMGFVQTFAQPYFSDSITLSLSGLMTRRLQFHAAAGGSMGNVGLTSAGSEFTTYYATTGLEFALTRHLSLGTTYFYYLYDFEAGALLTPAMPHELHRHGVRAHLNLWAPLFRRARRPDAAR